MLFIVLYLYILLYVLLLLYTVCIIFYICIMFIVVSIFRSHVTQTMFQKSSESLLVVPVPKTSRPQALNDYCPVALAFIVRKFLERLVYGPVLKEVHYKLQPLQFEGGALKISS